MSQLALYHRLFTPHTLAALEAAPEYQKWLFSRTVEESNSRGVAPEVGEIRFADSHPVELANASAGGGGGEDEVVAGAGGASSGDGGTSGAEGTATSVLSYRCRRCRHQLATSNYILPHTASAAPARKSAYDRSKERSNPQQAAGGGECAHLFLEPLSWMRPELEQGKMEGRLECPNAKCGTSVGRYAWQGMKCSCGAWVVPGVSLGRGKVDEVREGTAGVRRGPGVKM